MTEAEGVLKPYDMGYPVQMMTVDLGGFADEYKGRTVQVIANPHQRFRREFATLTVYPAALPSGHGLVDLLGVVFGATTRAELEEVISSQPPDALRWLIYPSERVDEHVVGRPPRLIPCGLVAEWEQWISTRVKARATRSEP